MRTNIFHGVGGELAKSWEIDNVLLKLTMGIALMADDFPREENGNDLRFGLTAPVITNDGEVVKLRVHFVIQSTTQVEMQNIEIVEGEF